LLPCFFVVDFLMKNVVLLGSTGSIGTSTVKVAEDLSDQIRLLALAAGGNDELLLEQTRKHRPAVISINDSAKAKELQNTLGTSCEVLCGNEGLLRLATLPAADIVLIAIVGTAGLQPALAAIRATVCACWRWTVNTPRFSNASTASQQTRFGN
jgi:1-deoxy-D-xylulose-5-phosphate reductoisomerase